jgi:long-chain acyl-CoA synthetase
LLNLATILQESAVSFSGKTAIKYGANSLSYARLNAAANQVANGLKANGIGKGDKVALTCPNLPYFVIIYYGILKAGAVVVPLNVLFKTREVSYHLQDSDATAYFCFQGTKELPMGSFGYEAFKNTESCREFILIMADPKEQSAIADVQTLGQFMQNCPATFDTVQTMPDDTAVILYTSGTTGQPKGAELTHFNMFQNAVSSARIVSLTPDDNILIVLPLFHSFGQTVQMNAGILSGTSSVLLARFEPEAVLKALEAESITVFAGVPTMYWALLNYRYEGRFDLKHIEKTLRICLSGGASLPVEVIRAFEAKYNVAILEGYGLSETSPVASFNHLDKERKPGSIGTPIHGVEMKIFDDNDREVPHGTAGEVVIRGHNIMKGYYKRPEQTRRALRNDWFHSGDIGKMDEDGYFYIIDRTKDMIIRGGFNVYPREVEEVLLTHRSVSMAAVIGIPHESLGEEVLAFIIPDKESAITEQELITWAKQNMADYKYPRQVKFVEELPMTATGKILKKKLRENV